MHMYALDSGSLDLFKWFLLKSGVDPARIDEVHALPLLRCVPKLDVRLMQSQDGHSLLMHSFRPKSLEISRWLVDTVGADPHRRNKALTPMPRSLPAIACFHGGDVWLLTG